MVKASKNSVCLSFRRAFRGYRKKDVEEYIARAEQECGIAEENYQSRIALLTQENEHVTQIIRTVQQENERLTSDNAEYRTQLKDQGETIRTLYERLDLLGSETERLQEALNTLRNTRNNSDPTADDWKQRALTAEETLRRMAEAELHASNAERDYTHHIRLPFGKKAYLDMTLHKEDKSV